MTEQRTLAVSTVTLGSVEPSRAMIEAAAEVGFTSFEVRTGGMSAAISKLGTWMREQRLECVAAGWRQGRRDEVGLAIDSPPGHSETHGRSAAAIAGALRTDLFVLPPFVGTDESMLSLSRAVKAAFEDGNSETLTAAVAKAKSERERRRSAHLEALCRVLHGVLRVEPRLRFALSPTVDPFSFPAPSEVGDVVRESKLGNLRVVRDVAVEAARQRLLGEAPDEQHAADPWVGLTYLSDTKGLEVGMMPGLGALDWPSVCRDAAELRGPVVLKLSNPLDRVTLAATQRFLAV